MTDESGRKIKKSLRIRIHVKPIKEVWGWFAFYLVIFILIMSFAKFWIAWFKVGKVLSE